MTHVTCSLTAKNRAQLRNPTLGNRVWLPLPFSSYRIIKQKIANRSRVHRTNHRSHCCHHRRMLLGYSGMSAGTWTGASPCILHQTWKQKKTFVEHSDKTRHATIVCIVWVLGSLGNSSSILFLNICTYFLEIVSDLFKKWTVNMLPAD